MKTKIKVDGTTKEIEFPMPADMSEMMERFGELALFQMAEATLARHFRTRVHNLVKRGLNTEEIEQDLKAYRPKPYLRAWMRKKS